MHAAVLHFAVALSCLRAALSLCGEKVTRYVQALNPSRLYNPASGWVDAPPVGYLTDAHMSGREMHLFSAFVVQACGCYRQRETPKMRQLLTCQGASQWLSWCPTGGPHRHACVYFNIFLQVSINIYITPSHKGSGPQHSILHVLSTCCCLTLGMVLQTERLTKHVQAPDPSRLYKPLPCMWVDAAAPNLTGL